MSEEELEWIKTLIDLATQKHHEPEFEAAAEAAAYVTKAQNVESWVSWCVPLERAQKLASLTERHVGFSPCSRLESLDNSKPLQWSQVDSCLHTWRLETWAKLSGGLTLLSETRCA